MIQLDSVCSTLEGTSPEALLACWLYAARKMEVAPDQAPRVGYLEKAQLLLSDLEEGSVKQQLKGRIFLQYAEVALIHQELAKVFVFTDSAKHALKSDQENYFAYACLFEGLAQFYLRDYQSFEVSLIESQHAIRNPEEDDIQTSIDHLFGVLYEITDNPVKALALEKRILSERLAKQDTSRLGQIHLASIYHTLANIYLKIGDFDRALEIFLQHINGGWLELELNEYERAVFFNNMARVYLEKDSASLAGNQLRRSINILKSASFPEADGVLQETYYHMARSYQERSMIDSCLWFIDRGMELPTNNLSKDRLFALRGKIKGELKDREAGKKDFETAIKISQQNGAKDLETHYKDFALFFMELKQEYPALDAIQHSLICIASSFDDQDWAFNPRLDQVIDRLEFIRLLKHKSKLLREIARQEKGADSLWHYTLQTATLGIEVAQAMQQTYVSSGSKFSLAATALPIYENGIEAAYQLHRLTGENSHLETAFELSERGKALVLQENLQAAAALEAAGIPETAMAEEQEMRIQLAYLDRQKFELEQQSGGRDTLRYRRLLEQRQFLDQVHASMVDSLEEAYPAYKTQKTSFKPLPLAEIQTYLYEEDLGLIEYFWGRDSVYAFGLDGQQIRLVKVGASAILEKRIDAFTQPLTDRHYVVNQSRSPDAIRTFADQSYRLYEQILQPVRHGLAPHDQWVVVADGKISRIAFDALVEKPAAYQVNSYQELAFLVKSYTHYSAYTASGLLDSIAQRKGLAFGGFAPAYALVRGEDRSQSGARGQAGYWPPLLASQDEVKRIADLLGGKATTGPRTTEQNFREHLTDYGILHLAMHAINDDEKPQFSGLIFAEPEGDRRSLDRSVYENDGFLQAYEIYHLPFEAELAVLSACQTGAGKIQPGEGVLSLARAFRYAGVPSIVMSLWQADDFSTQHIMYGFYEALSQGESKSEALRQAKLQYLSHAHKDHPFFWAGFVMIGDDRALDHSLSADRAWMLWAALGLLLVGILGIFWWRSRKQSRLT
ncbi:MAG: CHAT domain-containing protein [Bacteroidota bacterium]